MVFVNFLLFLAVGTILLLRGRNKRWVDFDKKKVQVFSETVGKSGFFSLISKWNKTFINSQFYKYHYTVLGTTVLIGAVFYLILSLL